MTTPEVTVPAPTSPIWRVGRTDRPWDFIDWAYADAGHFRSRWDDPLAEYRVLYGAKDKVGAYLESLHRFRRDADFATDLAEYGDADAVPPGVVPHDWLRSHRVASAVVAGTFVPVQTTEWTGYLHATFRPRFSELGITELDGAVLRDSKLRRLTQAISRHIYEQWDELGEGRFDGINYESRFGKDVECWAIFERPEREERPFHQVCCEEIVPDDEELLTACHILGLELERRGPATRGAEPSDAWRA